MFSQQNSKRNEFFNVLENILSNLVEEPAAEMQSKEVVSSGRKIGVNQPMNADEATMEVDSSEKRLPLKKRSICKLMNIVSEKCIEI